jgi:hypothetical protein
MKITRIKPPMFRIGRKHYNEYEVMNFRVDIAEGRIKLTDNLKITQVDTGEVSYIRPDGITTKKLSGLIFHASCTIKIMKAQH